MKKVSNDTIVRTIVLFVVLLNHLLIMMGKNPLPFSEDQMYAALSEAATIIAALWAWWKNNSFTKEAIAADEYMNNLRKEAQ